MAGSVCGIPMPANQARGILEILEIPLQQASHRLNLPLMKGKLAIDLKQPEFAKVWMVLFSLFILGSFQLPAESFWDGAVSFDPPLPMTSGVAGGNVGIPATGFTFRCEGATNGYAGVTFQISSLMMLFNVETPKEEVKTISDLKNAVDRALRNDSHTTNPSTTVVKLDDRDAVCGMRPVSDAGPAKWFYGLTCFWQTNSVWVRGSILSVYVTAEKRETFDRLVASLKSVKLKSSPPPVKLARDGMQFLMDRRMMEN
jgi:hypothetical protein